MQLPESMWTEDAERLERILTPLVVQAAVDGARSAFSAAQRKDAGIAVLWSLINEAVRLWAQQYAALLVRGITQTTRTAVQAAIVAWIESGEHIDALVGSMATILRMPSGCTPDPAGPSVPRMIWSSLPSSRAVFKINANRPHKAGNSTTEIHHMALEIRSGVIVLSFPFGSLF